MENQMIEPIFDGNQEIPGEKKPSILKRFKDFFKCNKNPNHQELNSDSDAILS